MSLIDLRCDTCGTSVAVAGIAPGDGRAFCSQACLERRPAEPVGQLALDLGDAA